MTREELDRLEKLSAAVLDVVEPYRDMHPVLIAQVLMLNGLVIAKSANCDESAVNYMISKAKAMVEQVSR